MKIQMRVPNPEQRIVKAAKELFTERGFSNVSVRDICRDANVTPPTVYYYFKSKEALFEAVVSKTISMEEFIARLDGCRKRDTFPARIQGFTQEYLSSFPSELINVGLYVRHSTELDSLSANRLMAELGRIKSILVEIIQGGIADGEFRETDPQMAAECLLGMVNRFIFQRIHFQRAYMPTKTASYLSAFFLRAMKPTSRAKRRQ